MLETLSSWKPGALLPLLLVYPALAQQPQLSHEAEAIAKLIGVAPLIQKRYSLPPQDSATTGTPWTPEALTLMQQINGAVLSASLQVQGRCGRNRHRTRRDTEVRHFLEADRDCDLAIVNLAGIIVGAGVGGRSWMQRAQTENCKAAIA